MIIITKGTKQKQLNTLPATTLHKWTRHLPLECVCMKIALGAGLQELHTCMKPTDNENTQMSVLSQCFVLFYL